MFSHASPWNVFESIEIKSSSLSIIASNIPRWKKIRRFMFVLTQPYGSFAELIILRRKTPWRICKRTEEVCLFYPSSDVYFLLPSNTTLVDISKPI